MTSSLRLRRLALSACLASLPAALSAQQSIIDRAQQGSPAPVAPPPGAAEVRAAPGADTDAGTQRVAEPRKLPFRITASVDEQLYATGNVFLAPDSSPVSDTGALVSTTSLVVGIDTLPKVVGEGQLVFGASFSYQRNLHGLATSDQAIEDLDFDSYSLPLSASYRWGRGWEAAASLSLGSLYSIHGSPSQELLYRSTVPSLSVRKLTELRQGLVLATGAGVSFVDTQASLHDVPAGLGYRDDRNDQVAGSLDASLYCFSGAWTVAPSLRLAYGHYLHWEEANHTAQDRDDLTLGAGLTVVYAFSSWGSARVFAGYDIRESDSAVDYDYDSGSAGLGVSLSVRF